jgi:hypothetical protein
LKIKFWKENNNKIYGNFKTIYNKKGLFGMNGHHNIYLEDKNILISDGI